MFAASRNIASMTMTSRMMAHQQKAVRRQDRSRRSRPDARQQKAVRRQDRGRRSPDSSSPSSSNSSRSGSRTPKATNVHTNTNSDNFDQIWKDLVADHKIFPTEDQSSHHPLESNDCFQTNLREAQWQVGRTEFEEGRARATRGDYSGAIDLFTQALAAQQKANLNENSPYIARTLVGRGNASTALGKLYDAVLDLEKALLIERRASGASEYESLDVADSYLRLGALQHRRGNFVEAVHCFECALAIRQRILGANDIFVCGGVTAKSSAGRTDDPHPGSISRRWIFQGILSANTAGPSWEGRVHLFTTEYTGGSYLTNEFVVGARSWK